MGNKQLRLKTFSTSSKEYPLWYAIPALLLDCNWLKAERTDISIDCDVLFEFLFGFICC